MNKWNPKQFLHKQGVGSWERQVNEQKKYIAKLEAVVEAAMELKQATGMNVTKEWKLLSKALEALDTESEE